MAGSLTQLALPEVLRQVHLRRYSRQDFAALPLPVLLALFDACKSASLVTDDTVALFLQDGLPDMVLSGVAGLLSSAGFRKALPPLCSLSLREIGLYNCNGLTGDDIDWLLQASPQLESLNVGRLRPLTDEHVLRLPLTIPRLQTLVLNRNPQLENLSPLSQLANLRELSLFGCTRLKRVAQCLGACGGLTSLNVTRVCVEDWSLLATGCPRLRVLVAPRHQGLPSVWHRWPELESLDATGLPQRPLPRGRLARLSVSGMFGPDCYEVLAAEHVRGVNLNRLVSFLDPLAFAEHVAQGAPALESFMALHPSQNSVPDALVRAVLGKPRLRELYLTGCADVTAAPFEALDPGCLPHLELAELAQMPGLSVLAVERLVQAALGLRHLNLSGNPAVATPNVAEEIALRCGTSLAALSMAGCGVGAWNNQFVYNLCALRRLCCLKNFVCSGSGLEAEGLMLILSRVPTLASLDACRTAVGDQDPECAFRAVPRSSFFLLATLAVDGNGRYTPALLELLLPRLPRLTGFSAQSVEDAGAALHLLPGTLMSCKLSKTALESWQLLSLARACPLLSFLDLAGCRKLTDEDVRESLAHWRQLCCLHLSCCNLLTDTCLDLMCLDRLEVLHVEGTQISANALRALALKVPFLNSKQK